MGKLIEIDFAWNREQIKKSEERSLNAFGFVIIKSPFTGKRVVVAEHLNNFAPGYNNSRNHSDGAPHDDESA